MAEPEVVRVMRAFKRALLDREVEAMVRMGVRWLEVERSLESQIQVLAEEVAAMQAAGQVVTDAQIYRMDRFQALLRQTRAEVGRYEGWAEGQIVAGQREAARLGIVEASEAIRASGVRVAFNRLPVSAAEYMVGLSGDGSPLFDVLKKRALWPEAVDGLASALVKGTALGWNPRKTASRMADGLAQGLDKALVIARSEQLRVYRRASVEQYRESGVVSGFKRLATKDDRTCMACLLADGQRLDLESELDDHPGGRCAAVPIVRGMPEVQWQTGREWFLVQPAERQREIMNGRHADYYSHWQRGEFELDQLLTIAHSSTWGDSPQVTPLRDLVAA